MLKNPVMSNGRHCRRGTAMERPRTRWRAMMIEPAKNRQVPRKVSTGSSLSARLEHRPVDTPEESQRRQKKEAPARQRLRPAGRWRRARQRRGRAGARSHARRNASSRHTLWRAGREHPELPVDVSAMCITTAPDFVFPAPGGRGRARCLVAAIIPCGPAGLKRTTLPAADLQGGRAQMRTICRAPLASCCADSAYCCGNLACRKILEFQSR